MVDLDARPPGVAVAAATDRLLRMRHGEQVELLASKDLDPVWREVGALSPDSYRFTVLQDGSAQWRLHITRRGCSTPGSPETRRHTEWTTRER